MRAGTGFGQLVFRQRARQFPLFCALWWRGLCTGVAFAGVCIGLWFRVDAQSVQVLHLPCTERGWHALPKPVHAVAWHPHITVWIQTEEGIWRQWQMPDTFWKWHVGKIYVPETLACRQIRLLIRPFGLSVPETLWVAPALGKRLSVDSSQVSDTILAVHAGLSASDSLWFFFYEDLEEEAPLRLRGNLEQSALAGTGTNLSATSGVDLSIEGRLTPEWTVRGFLTDRSLPVQPSGISQEIQEFDRIFIEARYREEARIRAGDVFVRADHALFPFQWKARGLSIAYTSGGEQFTGQIAFPKGHFARVELAVEPGVRGPYRITVPGRTFIVILAGTERVWLNGQRLYRGEDAHYIINYNTGEIWFTERVLFSEASRVIVEFQYMEPGSQQVLWSVGYGRGRGRWSWSIHAASQQDQRTPFLRTLQGRLSGLPAGGAFSDSVVVVWSPRKVPVSLSDPGGGQTAPVLYRLIDTVVQGIRYDSVLVYVPDPQRYDSLYEVVFTEVGWGKGNYVLAEVLVNGKVYRWVPPQDGVPSGNYEPILILRTPQSTTWAGFRLQWALDSMHLHTLDVAASYWVPSRLAPPQTRSVETGYAFRYWGRLARWSWTVEYQHARYRVPERIRPVEFRRAWGYLVDFRRDLWLVTLARTAGSASRWEVQALVQQRTTGVRNQLHWQTMGFQGRVPLTVIRNDSLFSLTAFPQLQLHRALLDSLFLFQVRMEGEALMRRTFANPVWDSLSILIGRTRFSLQMPVHSSIVVEMGGRTETYARMAVHSVRTTWLGQAGVRIHSSGWTGQLRLGLRTLRNQQLFPVVFLQMEKRAVGRRGQSSRFNGLTGRVSYQLDIQQIPRYTVQFIPVAPGQGTHTWIDQNQNGVQEIFEFLPARFPDEATYIQTYAPSGDYLEGIAVQTTGWVRLALSRLTFQAHFSGQQARLPGSSSAPSVVLTLGDILPLPDTVRLYRMQLYTTQTLNWRVSQMWRPAIMHRWTYTVYFTTSGRYLRQTRAIEGTPEFFVADWRFRVLPTLRWTQRINQYMLRPDQNYAIQGWAAGVTVQRAFRRWQVRAGGTRQWLWLSPGEGLFHVYRAEGEGRYRLPQGALTVRIQYVVVQGDTLPGAVALYEITEGTGRGRNWIVEGQARFFVAQGWELLGIYQGRWLQSYRGRARHTFQITVRYSFQ